MITDSLHHVSLSVRDLDASLRFYCDLLGLTPIERPDFGFPGAWLQAGTIQLHLIVAPEGVDTGSPPEKTTPLANHLAFAVSDFHETVTALEKQGLEVITVGAASGQCWVTDPSGNVIEFRLGS